jgi:hypothetical protein
MLVVKALLSSAAEAEVRGFDGEGMGDPPTI